MDFTINIHTIIKALQKQGFFSKLLMYKSKNVFKFASLMNVQFL